jgi:predicted secreted protein
MKGQLKFVILLIIIIIGEVMNKTIHEISNNNSGNIEISCIAGETISLKLRGNKTTGYSWFLNNKPSLNNNAIEPLNLDEKDSTNDYRTDENPNHLLGVGGYFYFDFKISDNADSQTVDLVFNHKRPWEHHSNLLSVKLNILGKNDL